MDTGTIIGIVSAVAAIAAAMVSWLAAKQSQKSSHIQQRLATHAAAADWLKDLREWASEAIDVLSESSYTCAHTDNSDQDCAAELRRCQHRLSALIDRGRFFVPNQSVSEFGMEKPTA